MPKLDLLPNAAPFITHWAHYYKIPQSLLQIKMRNLLKMRRYYKLPQDRKSLIAKNVSELNNNNLHHVIKFTT